MHLEDFLSLDEWRRLLAKVPTHREIYPCQAGDIEEMIQSRIEERSWAKDQMPASDELWPEAFCLGE